MMYWTDDPVRDASDYYGYLEKQAAMREARCQKCNVCGKAIDPEDDPHCYNFIDSYAHVQCVNKMIEKCNLEQWLKDMVEEALEETFYEGTPPVEE